MSRPRFAALCCCLLVTFGCRIEDHTPTGSRRDDEAIQRLLTNYARDLSARDWDCVRDLFWHEATYELATRSANIIMPIDSARRTLLPRTFAADTTGFEVRILRADTRQEGDLAAAWVITRRRIPHGGFVAEDDRTEHLVLRRIGAEWRILNIALTDGGRRRS